MARLIEELRHRVRREKNGTLRSAPMTPSPPMQRTHQRRAPLTADELAEAREGERVRKQWDPDYITAAEAREIPPEAMSLELQRRIRYSQPQWPENRMSATEALGHLEPGAGERYAPVPDTGPFFWSPSESEG